MTLWRPLDQQGRENFVKLLVNSGANLELVDRSQWTAMHHAAINGHHSCMLVLLQGGKYAVCETAHWGWVPLIPGGVLTLATLRVCRRQSSAARHPGVSTLALRGQGGLDQNQ